MTDTLPGPATFREALVPPQALDAERSVLAALLLDAEAIGRAVEAIEPRVFYRTAHQKIYEAIVALYERNEKPDLVTLAEELRKRGDLEAVGGAPALAQILEYATTTANLDHHIRIIHSKAILRQLIHASSEIQQEAYAGGDETPTILDRAEQRIFAITDQRVRQGFVSVRDLLKPSFEHIQKMFERQALVTGVPTGYPDLDEVTSGFQNSDLIILAGRPAMGKCLTGRTLIDDPVTGERLTIEECVRRRRPRVLGVSETGAVRSAAVADWMDNGVKPCFRLTTRLGRSIEATANHPFLTVEGWTPLSELTAGESILVRRTPFERELSSRSSPVLASRSRPSGAVAVLDLLPDLATSADLGWDEIVAIEPIGMHRVFDLTVPDGSNFIANDICVHNSALALNFAENCAIPTAKHERVPVAVFSLEMSKEQLAQRLLCSQGGISLHRVRSGRLQNEDWPRLTSAAGLLNDAPILIDDSPAPTLMEIRAKCRRLRAENRLGMLVIDYLQLIRSSAPAENRVQEISQITRGLKGLAKELNIPIIALSQLSRAVETRDKSGRPQLSDLRESGCLTADTRIQRADTGEPVTMGELLARGERDIPVWTLDDDLRLVRGRMTHVFPSGVKPVFEMKLASGHSVKASANHPFLTLDGWRPLERLERGTRLAVPRAMPEPDETKPWPEAEVVLLAHMLGDGCFASRQPVHYTSADPANLEAVSTAAAHFGITPRRVPQETWCHVYLPAPYRLTHGRRNPIQQWLGRFGLSGLRSHQKFVPAEVFGLPRKQVALFLRHLWATDGCIHLGEGRQARIYYASNSPRLIEGVQDLLLRFGVMSRIKSTQKGDYRPCLQLHIYGSENQLRFLDEIGVHGSRGERIDRIAAHLRGLEPNTNVDTVPLEIWRRVRAGMTRRGVTTRAFAAGLGTAYCGTTLFKHAPSRGRLGAIAALLDDPALETIARSDVFWDEIASITPLGEQPVFDATVPGTHNFVANGIVAHNSIEQDADLVMFVYREIVYKEDAEPNKAELIIAKQRNGPTGSVKMTFMRESTKFVPYSPTFEGETQPEF